MPTQQRFVQTDGSAEWILDTSRHARDLELTGTLPAQTRTLGFCGVCESVRMGYPTITTDVGRHVP